MAARLLGLPQAHDEARLAADSSASAAAPSHAMGSLDARATPSVASTSAPASSSVPEMAVATATLPPLNQFAGLRSEAPALAAARALPESSSGFERASSMQPAAAAAPRALELGSLENVEQLRATGPDVLKAELIRRGMKCGGTLDERAARLWKARGIPHWKLQQSLDPSLFAKKSAAEGTKRPAAAADGGFVRQQGPLQPGEVIKRGQKRIRSSRVVAGSQHRGGGGSTNDFGMPAGSILMPENSTGDLQ